MILMNYKLEKFWNNVCVAELYQPTTWTINLKSFEMVGH